jgi:tRNA(Ile)-lysidine synthase
MVLLQVLHELARESGWKLTVAHLNHQLRGTSSLADERLVGRTARDLKLPAVVSRANVRGFAREHGLSIEMAARRLRHEFLAGTAVRNKIPSLALAHHLDDQIELFFLRLFRGSGSQGLAGMKWSSPSPSIRAITLVRPLLDCSKQALLEYAAERKVPFREDASNLCLDIQRNRIRHQLLPLLRREYQPGLSQTILRAMDLLGAENEFVTSTAESWLLENRSVGLVGSEDLADDQHGRPKLESAQGRRTPAVTPFEGLDVAVQRRCLQLQLHRLGIAADYDLVEHLRLDSKRPIEVSQDRIGPSASFGAEIPRLDEPSSPPLRLVCNNGQIVPLRPAENGPFHPGFTELDLRKAGKRDWHGVRLAWQVRELPSFRRPEQSVGSEVFDATNVGPTAVIRHWQPGDRFQPIGMDRPVKLQDLFVNQKVPRERRRHLLVATTVEGKLFWVESLRISERFKLTSTTIRRLHWSWRRL